VGSFGKRRTRIKGSQLKQGEDEEGDGGGGGRRPKEMPSKGTDGSGRGRLPLLPGLLLLLSPRCQDWSARVRRDPSTMMASAPFPASRAKSELAGPPESFFPRNFYREKTLVCRQGGAQGLAVLPQGKCARLALLLAVVVGFVVLGIVFSPFQSLPPSPLQEGAARPASTSAGAVLAMHFRSFEEKRDLFLRKSIAA